MDERRDPGEFYPGGRVMVRPDVAPPQMQVRWSDIQGKPDLSDVAELGEEATRGEMKQTMNTVINKLKTSLLIGALFVVGSAVADVEPLFAKADDIPGNQQIMTNTQEYVDAKVAGIPEPDFSTSNETLVATIEATAPAPGNYAAVSNAAMSAVQPAELVAATNGIPRVEAANPDMFPGWAKNAVYAGHADYSDDSGRAYLANAARSLVDPTGTETRMSDTIFMQLDSIAGKASTNDVQLAPVYGGNGERLGEWVIEPPIQDAVISWADNGWELNFTTYTVFIGGDESSVSIEFEYDTYPFTATRTENPIIGYTLGDQTNKVLSSTNDLARASALAAVRSVADAAASTNAAQSAALSQQSQSLSTLSSQVNAIGAHLNAEDARFVSTNYNSATHMPEAYVEVKITENGEPSWLTVWREMTRWDWFLGIYTNQYAVISAALADKGEREYAFYDGVTGESAPDGFFWISQPRIAVAAGMSYQRYVDTGGAVWVLESNGMVADVNGTTNGFFRISDDEGNTQFEIVKGSARTVVAAPGAMTHESVMGVTHWFTTYAVTNAASAPVAMFCRDIGSQEWHAETDGDCPCNVSWTNPESGVYVCEWWAKGTEPKMFMRAKYGQGTESRIVQTAPVEMQYIVINGVKYTLGTATIDGKTVLTLTP